MNVMVDQLVTGRAQLGGDAQRSLQPHRDVVAGMLALDRGDKLRRVRDAGHGVNSKQTRPYRQPRVDDRRRRGAVAQATERRGGGSRCPSLTSIGAPEGSLVTRKNEWGAVEQLLVAR